MKTASVMALVVSGRPDFISETVFRSWPVHVGFGADRVAWERFLSEYFPFPLNLSCHRFSIFNH